MVRVALTGTPGVGKTTLAELARRDGWRVIDVKQWAKESDAIMAYDEADDAQVIDLDVLRVLVEPDDGSKVLYEGHLSHFLPVDVAWVVRCDPKVLRERLALRGYHEGKVIENLEAEALDLILMEASEKVPRIVQRDGTARTPEQLYAAFSAATDTKPSAADVEAVDWSDQFPFARDGEGAAPPRPVRARRSRRSRTAAPKAAKQVARKPKAPARKSAAKPRALPTRKPAATKAKPAKSGQARKSAVRRKASASRPRPKRR